MVVVDKIKENDVDLDDKIEISEVLLVGTRMETLIGRPFVPGAKVLIYFVQTLSIIFLFIFMLNFIVNFHIHDVAAVVWWWW